MKRDAPGRMGFSQYLGQSCQGQKRNNRVTLFAVAENEAGEEEA